MNFVYGDLCAVQSTKKVLKSINILYVCDKKTHLFCFEVIYFYILGVGHCFPFIGLKKEIILIVSVSL